MAITTYSELKTAVANWLSRDDLTSRIPEFIAMAEDYIAQDLRVRAMETQSFIAIKAVVPGVTVGGTANAITLTPTTAATSYALGDRYSFEAASNNTTTATVDISGLGAQTIKILEGGTKRNLEAAEIQDNVDVYIYYDGTDFVKTPPGGIPLPSRHVETRRIHLSGSNPLKFVASPDFWTRYASTTTGTPEIFTVEGDFYVFAPRPDAAIDLLSIYYRRFATMSADSDANWILTNARNLLLSASLMQAYIYLDDTGNTMKFSQVYEDLLERVHKANSRSRHPPGYSQARVPHAAP